MRPIASLEACGGWSEREDDASLAGKRWSLDAVGGDQAAYRVSLRMGTEERAMEVRLDQGKDRRETALDLVWGTSLWRVEIGARHRGRIDSLRAKSSEGGMDLAWPETLDSMGFAFRLPVGAWSTGTRWWSARSRSPEATGNHVADTTRISGWGLVARRTLAGGALEARLWREDRFGIATGHRGEDVFLEQVVESSRAELALDWRNPAWDLSLATRQWRLSSPRGRLDHPSLHWNRLSQGDFAPFASLVEDRSDYLWGSLSVETWDLAAGRAFEVGGWRLHPRWSLRLLDLDADLQRVRLVVKTFLPSTSRDTLASGAGWLAQTGPRLDLSRAWRWGTANAWAGIRFPVAGDWVDRTAKIVSTSPSASALPTSKSLPIDPLGSWEWGGSWEF